jgi:hypothetical protein
MAVSKADTATIRSTTEINQMTSKMTLKKKILMMAMLKIDWTTWDIVLPPHKALNR